ncbi:uncharacterized protein YecE (DUF72 family) [Variovorax sp. 1140]|uniref:DUF72 domain-containing protein n=1 Tax=Variovorax atrisoli TaxID=3394203 RepID=UPI0034778931
MPTSSTRTSNRKRSPAASGARGDIRIGISGWRYAPWRGRFYPAGLTQRNELAFASRMLPSIELNGSFYSLQRPESYEAWRDQTPDGFVFAVKGSRYITHMLQLKDVRPALANFFASGVLALGAKLGPILWQLPPSMRYDLERIDAFLSLLPRDAKAAVALAREHDERMEGRSSLKAPRSLRIRHAIEVRHRSFADPDFIAMLRRHGVALVVADTAGRWPLLEDLTADFVYIRLHGDKELYASGYGDAALDRWAQRIEAWSRGRQVGDARLASDVAARRGKRDVYCYFDNDMKVHAPYDAAHLAKRLGLTTGFGPDDSSTDEAASALPKKKASRRE